MTNSVNNIAIDLIADSGIQFYRTELSIDTNEEVLNQELAFWEVLDFEKEQIVLEFARFIEDYDLYAREKQMRQEGFIDDQDNVVEGININLLETKTDEEVYSIYDVEETLKAVENQWIPLPYFQSNNAGSFKPYPVNWCRLRLTFKEKHGRILKYHAVLAFDTNTNSEGESPKMVSGRGVEHFDLCNNLSQILNYCNPSKGFNWLDEYLQSLEDRWRKLSGITFSDDDEEEPQLKYIARYVHLVKYLAELNVFPGVNLSRFDTSTAIDVDLILDIGNSRTNGILVEEPHSNNKSFDFTRVETLKLQDLTSFLNVYDKPFSMRLAFQKVNFGEIGHQSRQFTWPSFIRMGEEAKHLIYQESELSENDGKESMSYHSSPKRYLWDNELSEVQWELVNIDGDQHANRDPYIDGITQQFKEDGTFTPVSEFGAKTNFSRKSLMTFVFIELFAHAFTQVNSFAFKQKHGAFKRARRIRRIVVTCPTAMTQQEQVTLRQCAEDASIAISRFYSNTYLEEYSKELDAQKITIVPSVSDCKKDLSKIRNKKDWNYDEATCCQLVFMYAEIAQRYNNKCKKFFDLYGKEREDIDDYQKKSVTVASIDIGGGTTDLMINAYKYQGDNTAAIEPIPLYWESFNTAGDDLLKAIIKKILLDHNPSDDSSSGYALISHYARKNGVADVSIKMNTFFGTDSNNFGYKAIQIRKKFNVQILIPIAEFYLEQLSQNNKDDVYTFNDIFSDSKPNKKLLDYFEEHWGFRFEDIQWPVKKNVVNGIVEGVFNDLIKHLTILSFVKKCDFLLLAGRPTSLEVVYRLFLKYFPVSPDRIINLKEYRVGRWYPFQDGNGKFKDYKSIVSVGAAIALMGGQLDKLSPFRLIMDSVKRNIGPTSEYFGIFNTGTNSFSEVFISPDINRVKLVVESFPKQIGTKQLPSNYYPSRLIYELDLDYEYIYQKIKEQNPALNPQLLSNEVDQYIIKLKNGTPYTFSIVRQYNKSKEELKIENVLNGTKSHFKLKLKTINERKGHWMDTGEFVLSVNPD